MTLRAAASLRVLVLATENEETRREAWQEAEALLAAGSISHNYYNFSEEAIETCPRLQDWDELDCFATALKTYNSAESLARCTYVVARGRALAAFGRGRRDSQTIEELRRIYRYGRKLACPSPCPPWKQHLRNIKGLFLS
jgi:hypothetical protein